MDDGLKKIIYEIVDAEMNIFCYVKASNPIEALNKYWRMEKVKQIKTMPIHIKRLVPKIKEIDDEKKISQIELMAKEGFLVEEKKDGCYIFKNKIDFDCYVN